MGADPDQTQPETNPGTNLPLSLMTSATMGLGSGILQAGATFGPYQIVRKLGQGGMGMVYEARDTTLDRRVAVKVMRPELVANPDFKIRFLREARAAAQIMHPNVVVIHQAGDLAGTLFMAFEYVPGGDLASRLAKGAMPTADAVKMMIECASGLQAIHQAGMIHRDIKPQNIFIDEQGRAKLGDLGLARTTQGDDRVTMTGMAMGTPAFMSPEQIEGDADIDIRSDIHALGATLFNALTGHPPFTGQTPFSITHKVMTEERPLLRSLDPQLSDRLQRIVHKAMARNRDQRFKDPQELIDALRGKPGSIIGSPATPLAAHAGATGATAAGQGTMVTAVDGMASPTAPTVLSQIRPPPPGRRSTLGIILGALALFLVTAVAWLALHASNAPRLTAPIPADQRMAGATSSPIPAAAPPAAAEVPASAPAPLLANSQGPATTQQAIDPAALVNTTPGASDAPPTASAPAASNESAVTAPVAAASPSVPTPAAEPDEHDLHLMHVEDRIGVDRPTAERLQDLLMHLRQKVQQILEREDLPMRERRQQVAQERSHVWQKASTFLMPAQLDIFTQMLNAPRARPGMD